MFVGDAITVLKTIKTGAEYLRDWQDDRRDIEAFDAFEQRFITRLETALEKVAGSSTFDCPMDEILDRYYDNREQILERVAEINVVNEQRALETLVEEMVAVIVEELDEEIDQQELENAVRVAYRETLENYITDASTDEQLQLRMSRDIQEDVDTILEELTTWKEQLNPRPDLIGRQEKFRLLYPATDDNWSRVLSNKLGVAAEREELAFLPPDGFSNVTDSDTKRVVLAGRKGSGKSRTLFESVVELAASVEFDRVVVITKNVAETSDLSRAFQDVNGNALLVFDDLQSASNDFDLGDALTELEQRTNSGELYVRATTRTEDIDTVFPAGYDLTNLRGRRNHGDPYEQWTAFHAERLPPLEGERLELFVEEALEFKSVTAPPGLREEFVEAVVERDPTPFYVTSVCANAGDRLTRQDLENLPANAVEEWYDAYDRLNRDHHALLEGILVLDRLDTPKRASVIKTIYESEVFSGTDGGAVVDELDMNGWLSVHGGRRERNITIHDIRLEAVERQLVGEDGKHASLAEFFDNNFVQLQNFLKSRQVDRFPDDIGALLNTNFAAYVYENGISRYPVEDAQQHFERATEIVRESPQIYTTYVRFLDKRHAEDGEIIELYEKAVAQVSRDRYLYWTFAYIIRERGNREQAREVLEDGLERIPDDTLLHKKLAEMWERDGNLEEAIEVLENGLEHAPDSRWMRHDLAELLEEKDELEKAIKVYQEGLEHAPDDSWMRGYLAKVWEQDGEREKAIEVLDEGLEDAPGDSMIRCDLAAVKDRDGDREEAIKVLTKGLEHAPGDRQMCRDLAELLEEKDELKKAIKVYEEGLEHAPDDSRMREYLSKLLVQDGEREKAIEVLKEGIKQDPGDRGIRENLSRLWENDGNYTKAIDVLEGYLEHEPDFNGFVRRSIAKLWDRDGNLKKAIEVLEEGLEQDQSNSWTRSKLARLCERDGDFEKAIDVLDEGLEDAPGDSRMRRSLAELWVQDDDLKKAIEVLDEGLKHTPADNRIRSELAELWEEDGHRGKGIEVLEEGLKHAPGNRLMRRKLAKLYEADDDLEKAIEVLEEGFENDPDDNRMRRELAKLLAENYKLEEATDKYDQIIDTHLKEETIQAEFAEMLEYHDLIEKANVVRELPE